MKLFQSKDADLIPDARQFATAAHTGQMRRFTDEAYIEHPRRVAERVEGLVSDEGVAAAWLHDVIEETDVGPFDVNMCFGFKVYRLVCELTHTFPQKGLNRAHRQAIDRARFSFLKGEVGHTVHTIKVADCLDNIPTIREYDPQFWKVMHRELCELQKVLVLAETRIAEEFNHVLHDYSSLTLQKLT